MGDTENELNPDLIASVEEREEFYSYLWKLYEEEGNLTFPLWAFDIEVRYNFERIKREYDRKQAILEQDEDLRIRLDALENALDSIDVEGTVLFGVPGVVHMHYIRGVMKDDELVRRLLCGVEKENRRRQYYKQLDSIKKLVEETMTDIYNYLEGATSLDLYEDAETVDLYICLHRVMARPSLNLMRMGWRGRSGEGGRERYDVFISHAGEDKRTVAMPLQESLWRHGVKCFLDIEDLRPGDLGWNSMNHAMESAPVGVVILSPEFAAKRWPVKELNCFLKRRRGKCMNCMVVPVFYRLKREDCNGWLVSEEVELFERLGFFERVRTKETSVKFVGETLREVRRIDGINNEEGAGNWDSMEMKGRRDSLIKRVVDMVLSSLESYVPDRESDDRVGDNANEEQTGEYH